jgi:hypothetical protein
MKIWKHFSIVCILAFFAFSFVFMSCPDADDVDKNDNESVSVSGETPTPTAADFNIGNLSQMSGNVTAVTITPKPGKSNGNITIYYNGSTTLPTNVGEYTVTFNVSATSDWKAANGLSAGTLNINFLSVNDLSTYLDSKSDNTKDNPYIIKLKIDNVDDFETLKTILNNASDKYVYLDLSGSTITTIPSDAFSSSDINEHQGLAMLIGVTIPDSVKSIGNDAFRGCTNLISVTFEGTIPSSGFSNSYAFEGDLRAKFYTQNSTNGTPGTYTTTAPVGVSSIWTMINGEDPTPTASDFNIDNLSQTKDNISAVTITPKPGKSNGTITIYYNGSTTLPTNVGTYVVAFNVSAASGWKAANGLSAGTLTISDENPTPTVADFNIDNLSQTKDNISAVTITPKSGKSNGTITIYYDDSTTLPTNVGTYTVTFDVSAASGWKAANDLSAGILTIEDPTPTAEDFNIGNLSQIRGSVTKVTITPKSGKSNGTITIYYNGLTTLPTVSGTYVVAFNVAAATGWKAATGLSAGMLTIEDPTPIAADFSIGNLSQIKGDVTAVTITPYSGKSNGTITIYYNGSTTLPTNVGTYSVTFDVAAASGWKTATGLSAGTLTIRLLNISELSAYLSGKPYNNKDNPYFIEMNINETDFSTLKDNINYRQRYVYLDLSGSNITTIPNNAFYDGGSYDRWIIGITIGNNINSIGNYAFYNCTNLTSVTIGNSVTSIGNLAFFSCKSLASVTIGNKVNIIANSAFGSCTSLTSITIPNSVISIGDAAFANCANLANVTIGNSVTSIGGGAFGGCGYTSIIIPNSVTTIGNSAFANCANLTSITIPNSVTSIGTYRTFGDCTSLTSVTIGSGITTISAASSFDNCTSLTEINIDVNNTTFSSDNGILYNKTKTTLIKYPRGKTDVSFSIPNSVTSIYNVAFEYCTSLTSVTIPDSVTSIGGNAFYGCTSLTSVIIPNGVTSIDGYAFYGCTSLTSVIIPNSVTGIDWYALYGCTSLASINIPNSVTFIWDYAFSGCTSLASVTIPENVTSIGEGAFNNCTSLISVTFEGTIASANYASSRIITYPPGDFREVYLKNGIGTYTRQNDYTWTKQQE